MTQLPPLNDAHLFVAGGTTLFGSALLRRLHAAGCTHVSDDVKAGLDLTRADAVRDHLAQLRPDYVLHAAGLSGGIDFNRKFPAQLADDNLTITTNLLRAAQQARVGRLVYFASSCCYPRACPQPMRTEHLWTGPLEETNLAYAAAKLTGIALCQAYRREHNCDFIAAIPANSFGVNDHFDVKQGHVVPALIVRMHEAKQAGTPEVAIWGTGKARREFMFADDVADAALFILNRGDVPEVLNLAGGEDVSIAELATQVAEVVGYTGRLTFDVTKPDGMPLKSLDGAVLRGLGYSPHTSLREALRLTYQAYLNSDSHRELALHG